MAVSFLEAYRKKNADEISWDGYIEHLFARCKGVKHPDDNRQFGHWELRYEDPFGYSIWRWCKTMPQMTDSTSFEDVFKTYRRGFLEDVKIKLEALSPEDETGIRKILAFLALQDRRADVLKFCLEKKDFPYESYFVEEANGVDTEKDPGTFKVLEESHFRAIFPRVDGSRCKSDAGSFQNRFEKPILKGSATQQELLERAAKFDVGGSHPVDW